MEYTFKNSRKERPVRVFLGDMSMRIVYAVREDVIHYSGIQSVWVNKSAGSFSVTLTTIDNSQHIISNKFINDTGQAEDKSHAYALFVRVLHLHLKQKSKARVTCVKKFHLPEWQKLLWVPLAFAIAFMFDVLGYKLFHWAIQGAALAASGLILIIVSERNRAIEKSTTGEIPIEYLPG
jgi:hypothetical protein